MNLQKQLRKQLAGELILALANIETRKQRWDICNACEYITKNRICLKCGCMLKFKILLGKKCPINKWSSI